MTDENIILDNALNNPKNDSIVKLNTLKIFKAKKAALSDLNLTNKEINLLSDKLLDYRLVEELPDIGIGNYIRWISIKEGVSIIKLTNGGVIIDILLEEDGVHIKCKNNMNRIFQIRLDEKIIFQKLTKQEEVLIKVLDYLET
jgi:hypothetical protein